MSSYLNLVSPYRALRFCQERCPGGLWIHTSALLCSRAIRWVYTTYPASVVLARPYTAGAGTDVERVLFPDAQIANSRCKHRTSQDHSL